MLKWQSDSLRTKLLADLDRIDSLPVLYPLPRPTDGLPEGWSFGDETPDSLSRKVAQRALVQAADYLDKCNSAIAANDHPKAIYCLVQAMNCQRSAWAYWNSSASVKTWRYIDARRKKLSKNAQDRNKVLAKYSTAQKDRWREELRELMNSGIRKNSAAAIIARKHKLPKALSTIRRLLDE